jgi:uncharacterized protein (DUF1800 family)
MKRTTVSDADVAHLLRRTGFEAAPAERARWVGLERAEAIERALATPTVSDGAPSEHARLLDGARFLEDQPSIERLQAWWLARCRAATPAWSERLALFWHGHFATSDAKVQDPRKMLHQHQRFLSLGSGRFPALLDALIEDPALLLWLDAPENTKDRPNENLARELFELFALGRGAYDERDVREAARALSGWRVKREVAELRWNEHDRGAKTILGEEAPFTPRALVALATRHPACARFVARKLRATFVAPATDDAALEAAAERFRALELDVRSFLVGELAREEFWSASNRRAHWKSPVEYVLGAVRQLDLKSLKPRQLAEHCAAMGQALFLPPNVGGWPGGSSWVSGAAMAARARFAAAAADELEARGERPRALEELMDRLAFEELDAPASEALRQALARGRSRDAWLALLLHPHYQRC